MSERSKDYAGGDTEFEQWLDEVDEIVEAAIGVGLFDLEDMLLWDCFNDGNSPEECVRTLVYEAVLGSYGEEGARLLLEECGR